MAALTPQARWVSDKGQGEISRGAGRHGGALSKTPFAVIPAKAGIQAWTPAYAGVT